MSVRTASEESTRIVAHEHSLPAESAPSTAAGRINAFVDHDLNRVVSTVSLWCGSPDAAEECVAVAVGRAWEHLDRGRRIDNLAGWITAVAMNEVRRHHRRWDRARRSARLTVVEHATPGPGPGVDARIDLQRALGTLGDRQRQVVALHYGLDLPIAEIANQLGIAGGTVKATLHRARRLLARELGITDEGGSR